MQVVEELVSEWSVFTALNDVVEDHKLSGQYDETVNEWRENDRAEWERDYPDRPFPYTDEYYEKQYRDMVWEADFLISNDFESWLEDVTAMESLHDSIRLSRLANELLALHPFATLRAVTRDGKTTFELTGRLEPQHVDLVMNRK